MAGLFDDAMTSGGWAPDQSDPRAWNAWAQTRDPGTYGYQHKRGLTVEDLGVLKPALQAAGKWNPAWDSLGPEYFRSGGAGSSESSADGMQGSAATQTLDLSSLDGYGKASARGPGYISLNDYIGPDGKVFQQGNVSQTSKSMKSTDWRDAATVIGGVIGGGYAIEALAGLGAEAGGAELLGEAGGYGFTSTEAAGVATELGAAGAGTAGVEAAATTAATTNTTASGSSFLEQLGNGVSKVGARDWVSIISGLYGMSLSRDAQKASDPFGPRREGYGNDLAALEANPNLIMGKPGWRAGQEIISRQMGARGYVGSGNEKGAMMRYAGDFYDRELNRLAGLAGAGTAPGNGRFNSAELAGQSLASIGYGLAPYFRGGGGGSGGSGSSIGSGSYNTGYEDPFKNVGGP